MVRRRPLGLSGMRNASFLGDTEPGMSAEGDPASGLDAPLSELSKLSVLDAGAPSRPLKGSRGARGCFGLWGSMQWAVGSCLASPLLFRPTATRLELSRTEKGSGKLEKESPGSDSFLLRMEGLGNGHSELSMNREWRRLSGGPASSWSAP